MESAVQAHLLLPQILLPLPDIPHLPLRTRPLPRTRLPRILALAVFRRAAFYLECVPAVLRLPALRILPYSLLRTF